MNSEPTWKKAIREEWTRREKERSNRPANQSLFPLIAQGFEQDEIVNLIETILTGQLTMATQVREFEKRFAAHVGSPFAVMVNSGSSANLLALAVATNPARKERLKAGDEVLVPAVCWSTSVWPVVQMGLKPVFVDADPRTLNMDLVDARRKITSKTRGMLAVHILGNSAPMKELLALAKSENLMLLEDTCESLGSRADGKFLGTFGAMGMYSFYYSHHMTTGEGGMVTCQTQEDADLLRCLRAHGWSRELSDRTAHEARSPDVDPRFLFVNLGYNLRPMDTQAAFGLTQLAKLSTMNQNRVKNHHELLKRLQAHPKWKEQFRFAEAAAGTEPVWFGFPALLSAKYVSRHQEFLKYLSSQGVENRPIVSGNFARQPALKLLGIPANPKDFPGAELINEAGFFFGLHTEELSDTMLTQLTNILLGFDFG